MLILRRQKGGVHGQASIAAGELLEDLAIRPESKAAMLCSPWAPDDAAVQHLLLETAERTFRLMRFVYM